MLQNSQEFDLQVSRTLGSVEKNEHIVTMDVQDAESWNIITIFNTQTIFNIPYSFSEESEYSFQCHRFWSSSGILSVSHSTEEEGRGQQEEDYLHFITFEF